MSQLRHFTDRIPALALGVFALALLLAALRIWLPIGVERYVNGVLRDIPGYTGSVDNIDMALFRGAYVIDGLTLKRVDAGSDIPFLDIARVDISIEWKALLHGEIVSELILTRPELRYVLQDHAGAQTGDPEASDWTEAVRDLTPLAINRLQLIDGKLAFLNPSAQPAIDLHLDQLELVATNLRNVAPRDDKLESTVSATATSIGGGRLTLEGSMNLMQRIPDVDMSLALEDVDLRAVNDISSHYAGLDFEGGSVSVYSELAIADGYLLGYVKPLLRDLDLIGDGDDLSETLWEGLVGFVSFVLENHNSDTVATKVPLEGDLNQVQSGVLTAIVNIFRNAWVKAFEGVIDNEVRIEDAQGAAAQD